MNNKIPNVLFLAILIFSCTNKKCKDAQEAAKSKPKDPALMYIWRYTNNLIKTIGNNERDSGFISFKPSGEYKRVPKFSEINTASNIWYVDGNTIRESSCLDLAPQDDPAYRYTIKNDTLYLFASTGGGKSFATIAETFIHVKKY
jgi:hypothetical protein